jgi:hypothetical protein
MHCISGPLSADGYCCKQLCTHTCGLGLVAHPSAQLIAALHCELAVQLTYCVQQEDAMQLPHGSPGPGQVGALPHVPATHVRLPQQGTPYGSQFAPCGRHEGPGSQVPTHCSPWQQSVGCEQGWPFCRHAAGPE